MIERSDCRRAHKHGRSDLRESTEAFATVATPTWSVRSLWLRVWTARRRRQVADEALLECLRRKSLDFPAENTRRNARAASWKIAHSPQSRAGLRRRETVSIRMRCVSVVPLVYVRVVRPHRSDDAIRSRVAHDDRSQRRPRRTEHGSRLDRPSAVVAQPSVRRGNYCRIPCRSILPETTVESRRLVDRRCRCEQIRPTRGMLDHTHAPRVANACGRPWCSTLRTIHTRRRDIDFGGDDQTLRISFSVAIDIFFGSRISESPKDGFKLDSLVRPNEQAQILSRTAGRRCALRAPTHIVLDRRKITATLWAGVRIPVSGMKFREVVTMEVFDRTVTARWALQCCKRAIRSHILQLENIDRRQRRSNLLQYHFRRALVLPLVHKFATAIAAHEAVDVDTTVAIVDAHASNLCAQAQIREFYFRQAFDARQTVRVFRCSALHAIRRRHDLVAHATLRLVAWNGHLLVAQRDSQGRFLFKHSLMELSHSVIRYAQFDFVRYKQSARGEATPACKKNLDARSHSQPTRMTQTAFLILNGETLSHFFASNKKKLKKHLQTSLCLFYMDLYVVDVLVSMCLIF